MRTGLVLIVPFGLVLGETLSSNQVPYFNLPASCTGGSCVANLQQPRASVARAVSLSLAALALGFKSAECCCGIPKPTPPEILLHNHMLRPTYDRSSWQTKRQRRAL